MKDRTWELMTRHLQPGDYLIVSSQDSAPSAAALNKAAKKLGCQFPDEFIAHATNKYGGLYVEVKEELWPRPQEFDVGPFWSFLYGMYTLNISAGIPEFLDLAKTARDFQKFSGLKAVPFLKIVGDNDAYCFDPAGNIVRYDHELNELEPDSRSFFELLNDELKDLAERKERKIKLLKSAKKKTAKKPVKKKSAKKKVAKKSAPKKPAPKKKKRS